MKEDSLKDNLYKLRHSLAHILLMAVKHHFPHAIPTIGPVTENGFYYDLDFKDEIKPSIEDFPKIEETMRDIIKRSLPFKREVVTADQARTLFQLNPYKKEIIEDLERENKEITIYYTGDDFYDLCVGNHTESTAEIEEGSFRLDKLAGAYWRGDEKNAMLTRIYGLAFESKKELDDYVNQREEATARDHKVLGPKYELFMFHHTAPGMPYWLPRGVVLYNELINFWREEHSKRDYQEIVSPLLNKKELYITSGHYDHYWNDMFTVKTGEDEEYGVKAMNCPNAMIVFGSKTRSYRDLPLRLSDTDTLHRNELSGTLNGLLRVREFRQDDAHIFVSEQEIGAEYKRVFEIVERFYSIFGMKYRFRLGTRPESYMGELETWNKAEQTLKTILEESGKDYFILEGDGAFYGPKVDILMNDVLGREWQMGTIQLDFQQPQRFKLEYTDSDGSKKTPVAIHRVIYGSLERFLGILIEHYGGAFPLWISPNQITILPIADKHQEYARDVYKKILDSNIRAEIDCAKEGLGKKIRNVREMKTPYWAVIGDNEVNNQTVTLEHRQIGKIGEMKVEELLEKLKEEIKNKK